MKTLMLLVALLTAGPAWASTITFEPGSDRAGWSMGYLQPFSQAQWQGDYGNTTFFPSGTYAGYNSYGVNWLSMSGPLSTVEGAWASTFTSFDGWYDPYAVHAVTLYGYADGSLVGSTTWDLGLGFQYFTTGFTDPVDALIFRTTATAPQWYLLDDLTLTVLEQPSVARAPSQGAVPEPSTWLFVGVGLLLIISTSLVITHAKARL